MARGRPLAARLLAIAVGIAWLPHCGSTEDTRPRTELLGDVGGASSATVTATGTASGGSAAGGSAAGGAGSGGIASGGSGGSGGMAACLDASEPNDSEFQPAILNDVNDCDSKEQTILGALDGAGDEDWFQYDGSDDFGCIVDPTRSLTASGSVRLCKFVECDGGGADVSCENGSTPTDSPQGRPGCCHTTGFGMDINCPGASDDARVYVRIDQGGPSCIDYELRTHY